MSIFSLKSLGIDIPTIQIMDVGAMIEGENRYTTLVEQGLAEVTGFEPNPVKFEELQRTNKGPYRYFPLVLGTGDVERFNATAYPGCSSIYEPDPSVINLFSTISTATGGNFRVLEAVNVETVRLDDIREISAVDFVKIDVQGSELKILQGGMTKLGTSLVMELESEFIPMYKDQPLFGDLQVFLREYGFVLHKFIDVGGRGLKPMRNGPNQVSPISQLLWADAVFVRDFTKPDGFSDADLLKAAAILNDVYRSVDLVYLLLREHDRRNDGGLGDRYVAAIKELDELPLLFMNIRDTY